MIKLRPTLSAQSQTIVNYTNINDVEHFLLHDFIFLLQYKTGYIYVHILNSTVHAVTAMSKMENERKALK